jgi:hypothetical protein
VTEICAPGITPPDESVIVPDRVAPVTCEYIAMATESMKTTASNNGARLPLMIFRRPTESPG